MEVRMGLRLCGVLAGLATALALAGPASAAPGSTTCSGTIDTPGTLSGSYPSNVTVNGACIVDAGPATIAGNLTVSPGSALVAAWGSSDLNVSGNTTVGSGGSLIMGCEPDFFPCFDDETLTSHDSIGKNLTGNGALGMLVHASTIGWNVSEIGGGPGLTCGPDPVFGFGPYSDFEDNSIGRNLTVSGLQTCWLGALRNTVAGNFTANGNTTADPDGNELVSNTISGNIACAGNNPAVQFGDSEGTSNQVGRNASGQCGFDVLVPNPEPDGPLAPISVKGV